MQSKHPVDVVVVGGKCAPELPMFSIGRVKSILNRLGFCGSGIAARVVCFPVPVNGVKAMKIHVMDLESGVVETLGLGQQIVIFQDEEGVIGWRGVGQLIPEKCQFMCSAEIHFEWKNNRPEPIGIGFYSDADHQWWMSAVNCNRSFEVGHIGCSLDGDYVTKAKYYK